MIYNQNPDKQVWKWHAVENGTHKLVEITGKRRYVTKLRVEGSSSRMAKHKMLFKRRHCDLRVGLKRKL